MSDKPPRDGRACFYALVLPRAIEAARGCGYALGLHGSMSNDCDLIAVPWTDDARPAQDLVLAVAEVVGGVVPGTWLDGEPGLGGWQLELPKAKPHGRVCWTIHYGGVVRLDLSVMPLGPRPEAAA